MSLTHVSTEKWLAAAVGPCSVYLPMLARSDKHSRFTGLPLGFSMFLIFLASQIVGSFKLIFDNYSENLPTAIFK